jgi:hypothetical protein
VELVGEPRGQLDLDLVLEGGRLVVVHHLRDGLPGEGGAGRPAEYHWQARGLCRLIVRSQRYLKRNGLRE